MAIGHVAVRSHSRSKGHTAAAGLAYRCGVALLCPRTGVQHDYSHRRGVAAHGILAPVPTPLKKSLAALSWGIEAAEKRSDSKIGRDLQVALPHELALKDKILVTKLFTKRLTKRYKTVAAWAVHVPTARSDGDPRNTHAHVWMATRELNEETGALENKLLQLDERPQSRTEIREIRLLWERTVNKMLVKRYIDARVDVGRRADGDPAPTLGAARTGLERRARTRRARARALARGEPEPESCTHGVAVADLVRDGGAVTGTGHRLAQHGSRRRRRRRVRIEQAVSAEPYLGPVLEELVLAPEPAPVVTALPAIEPTRTLNSVTPEPAPSVTALPAVEPSRELLSVTPEPAPTVTALPPIKPGRALVTVAPQPAPSVTALPAIGPHRELVRITPEPAPQPVGPRWQLIARIRSLRDLLTVVVPARAAHARLRQTRSAQKRARPDPTETAAVHAYWKTDYGGGGTLLQALQHIAHTRFGHNWESGQWDRDAAQRRQAIADRLHSPPHGPRVTQCATAAQYAAVVLDRYLVEVSRKTFGQCAPPRRPADPEPGESDAELQAWRQATEAAAAAWNDQSLTITKDLFTAIFTAEVLAQRQRVSQTAQTRRGVPPEGEQRD